MRVVIQLVTWNSLKFLPDCLASLYQQTYKNFSILVIDNASNDGTLEYLQKNYPEVNILRNNKNLGFTAAHNRGFKLNHGYDYVLVMNPDVILEKDWLEKILITAERDKKIGAIGGKLLKIYTSDIELGEKVKTKTIDSAGLTILRSRRVINRGENELDQKQYEKEEEVFGLSGACALFRFTALEDIKLKVENGKLKICEEYFDEDFFAYKEDLDLSWRLRLYGWKIIYCPQAVAYHYRQVFSGKNRMKEVFQRRRERSPFINYLSYRNHLFCLIKNDCFINFLKDLPFIFFYELKKLLYLFLFESKTLKAWWQIFKNLPKMLKKRKYIMKNKKISSKEIKKWFL